MTRDNALWICELIRDRDAKTDAEVDALNMAIKALEQEPIRVTGEWINDTRYSGWTCTHCNYHDGNKTDNFCPNCGADMGGDKECG